MLIANARISPAWGQLHRLQITIVVLFVCFIPVGDAVLAQWGSSMLLPFAGAYGGLTLFLQHQATHWKCPRCHKPFLRKNGNGFALPYRKQCGTCGLRHGANRV